MSVAARWNCWAVSSRKRVAHEHPDATLARVPADLTLQAADRKREGGQAEVGLGLAAAGGEEQQVGGAGVELALRVRGVGQRREVDKHEGELERPPRPVRDRPRRRLQRQAG